MAELPVQQAIGAASRGGPHVPVADRIAAAPISWGVCEVPDWGVQLSTERVLAEMTQLGIRATELGPPGFLPADPADAAATLRAAGLATVGGFVPAVLHDPGHDPVPDVAGPIGTLLAVGAGVLVLAATTGRPGYAARPQLDAAGWETLLANADRIADLAAQRGLLATLHPHAGTMVETAADVARVLDGTAIGLCLDTGHLMIGGSDPARLARDAAERIGHVHLKDVDAGVLARVRCGLTYTDAVRAGLYRPLGHGDVDIADIVASLEAVGYGGWYVTEQDTILDARAAAAPPAEGPMAEVATGLAFLRGLG
ncbi:MAG: TIM barrel protein [Mycobacteriales bacterium]